MKRAEKVNLLFIMVFLIMGCSLDGQLKSSDDTQWSSHYRAMRDRVQQNHPEMDHVLMFCNEMIQFADQYEHNAMSREEFVTKQQEMRALLQKEDEFRRQIAWQKEPPGTGPFVRYLASKRGGGKFEAEDFSVAMQRIGSVP